MGVGFAAACTDRDGEQFMFSDPFDDIFRNRLAAAALLSVLLLLSGACDDDNRCHSTDDCPPKYYCRGGPSGPRCVYACEGRQCGPGMVGVDCGSCPEQEQYCTWDGQCRYPCEGKECGVWHRGVSCGTCSGGEPYCDATGQCSATPKICPDDMVMIETIQVCVDKYEGLRFSDGSMMTMQGIEPSSQIGRLAHADDACATAGKHLCTEEEWLAACHGPPPGTQYPYGNVYQPDYCNGIGNVDVQNVVQPAGSLPQCEGGYPGIFDMAGNLWEWTSTCFGDVCRLRGGSLNQRGSCSEWMESDSIDGDDIGSIGFRCCL